ncbi:hypothetical protein BDZ97DRAFT_1788564 [Flammula alnicola]|nr:hypothetical protein BDZ97DRAFT_1788564 [Flammula alnicola]
MAPVSRATTAAASSRRAGLLGTTTTNTTQSRPSISASSLSTSSTAVASTSRQTAPLYVSPTWQAGPAAAASSSSTKPVSKRAEYNTGNATADDDVQCECKIPAVQRTVIRETATKGKKFWTCETRSCGFFQWVENAPPNSSRGVSNSLPAKRSYSTTRDTPPTASGDMRKCKCNEDGILHTTHKEGPNQGRKFWKCRKADHASCGFFEWDDEPPRTGGNFGQGGNGASSRSQSFNNTSGSARCFKCNEEGHFSNACPNDDASSSKRSRSIGTSANDKAASATCFKCQQPGHYSSSCPNGGSSNSAPKTFGNAASSDECYKCGKKGHWSTNCPQDGGGSGFSAKRSYSSNSGSSKRGRGGTRGKRGRGGGKKSKFGAADGY